MKPKVVREFHSTLETWHTIKETIANIFATYFKVFTQIKLKDITEQIDKENILEYTHKRAHRNALNNYKEILETCYWPTLKNDTETVVKNCVNCTENKYERKPIKQLLGKSPVPNTPGTSVQMDIFYINGKSYLSGIDRFTKYAYFRKLGSKLHFHEIIEEVLSQIFPNCTELMTDNESIFVGISTTALLNKLQIKHEKTANNHSTSNAQVERLHSTILEIARTLANDRTTTTEEETIHSVIKEKSVDLFFNQKKINEKVKNNIEKNQERMLEYHNRKRSQKDFKPLEIIYEKSSRREKYNKRCTY